MHSARELLLNTGEIDPCSAGRFATLIGVLTKYEDDSIGLSRGGDRVSKPGRPRAVDRRAARVDDPCLR